jgi:hypothetical protein
MKRPAPAASRAPAGRSHCGQKSSRTSGQADGLSRPTASQR